MDLSFLFPSCKAPAKTISVDLQNSLSPDIAFHKVLLMTSLHIQRGVTVSRPKLKESTDLTFFPHDPDAADLIEV